MSYQTGEHAFIVISSRWVRPVTIIRQKGNCYVLSLGHQSGVTLHESRIFKSEEEAAKTINPWKSIVENAASKVKRSQYDYSNIRSSYGI